MTGMKREIEGNHVSEEVKVGDKTYSIQQGGGHSVDEPGIWEADAQHRILDMDIRSFYPSVIENHKLVPSHLPKGPFLSAFAALKRKRLKAKDEKRKALADGLKISINSLYGKFGSAYGWLTDPAALLRCTVLGQLTLLTFVDLLQVEGVDIISANTDGITFRVRRELAEEVKDVCETWAERLGYEVEWDEFVKIARRDINNYLAYRPDGSIKAKGAYAYDPAELGKKANRRVEIDAVQAYFDPVRQTPLEETVCGCTSVQKFIDYFKCSRGYHIEAEDGTQHGGIARWYYGDGVHLDKVTADGKRTQLVERGAVVVPILPDERPSDVDYQHYIAGAQKLVDAILQPEVKFRTTIPRGEWSAAEQTTYESNWIIDCADLHRCREIDLPHEAWASRIKGSGYDTMKHLLVKLWLSYGGLLTRGDLTWCAKELDAADGYFATPIMQRTLKRMVDWIARDVSPFRAPVSLDEKIDRGWQWAVEKVEPLKRKKKTLTHRNAMQSDYLSQATINRYAKISDDFCLSCGISSVFIKHGKERDSALIAAIIADVHQYFQKD